MYYILNITSWINIETPPLSVPSGFKRANNLNINCVWNALLDNKPAMLIIRTQTWHALSIYWMAKTESMNHIWFNNPTESLTSIPFMSSFSILRIRAVEYSMYGYSTYNSINDGKQRFHSCHYHVYKKKTHHVEDQDLYITTLLHCFSIVCWTWNWLFNLAQWINTRQTESWSFYPIENSRGKDEIAFFSSGDGGGKKCTIFNLP